MVRTRDDASAEAMEVELKVDHPLDLEAAPSCTASSIPEGVAPSDEEDGQHQPGIRGMTVAFQVRLGRSAVGYVLHAVLAPSTHPYSGDDRSLQQLQPSESANRRCDGSCVLLLKSGNHGHLHPSSLLLDTLAQLSAVIMIKECLHNVVPCRTWSISSRTVQNGERRSASCPKCLAPSRPATSPPWSTPHPYSPLMFIRCIMSEALSRCAYSCRPCHTPK